MWRRDPRAMRDLFTFLLGAGTFIHQVVIPPVPQPLLVGASLVLMGVPGALRIDRRREEDDE